MKQSHTIDIAISPTGEITSEVKGVKGASCSKISKWLDDLGKVTHDQKTGDYYKKRPGQTVSIG